jgi:hypothetical protein
MAKEDIWVVPMADGWALKLELADIPFTSRPTKDAALTAARELAKASHCVLFILDDQARLENKESYRGIPRP